MGVEVTITVRTPVTVLAIEGDADPAALARVGDEIGALRAEGADGKPLVVDVSGLTWVHPAAIASLLAHAGSRDGGVRIVCERLTGRRLLRRCLPARACPPLFGSVAEAVGDLDDRPARRPATSPRTPRHDVAVTRARLVEPGELKPAS